MVLKTFPPKQEILAAFGLHGTPVPFKDGVHGAYRVGDVVLKHGNNPEYYAWLCEEIFPLSIKSLRFQSPLKTVDGFWSKDGWFSYRFLKGETLKGNLSIKLRISILLHQALLKIKRPTVNIFDKSSPWGIAERVAWEEEQIPHSLPRKVQKKISDLISVAKVRAPLPQISHLDLCGNILIHPGVTPALIDLVLTYRPVQFAEAILICDSILWDTGSIEDVAEWMAALENRRYLARACAFRLLVTAIFDLKSGKKTFDLETRMADEMLGKFLPRCQ